MTFLSPIHRKVISYIHLSKHMPLSIHEITKDTKVSRSSVIRILRRLVALKLMLHKPNSYAGRNYRMSSRWPPDNINDVIEIYEISKVVGVD